jgi:hypothetical protein
MEQVVEVSIIIPFKDLETLQRNLLNSFEKNQDGIEAIFVHDSKTPLKHEQRQRANKHREHLNSGVASVCF